MPQYSGLQSIYDAALGEYADRGFALREDDHLVDLYHHGQVIARFVATGVAIPAIRDACRAAEAVS